VKAGCNSLEIGFEEPNTVFNRNGNDPQQFRSFGVAGFFRRSQIAPNIQFVRLTPACQVVGEGGLLSEPLDLSLVCLLVAELDVDLETAKVGVCGEAIDGVK
jgi:hypothetical protein